MQRREALHRMALLTGGALSMSTVSAILSGCRADPDENYEAAALSADLEELVATISDLIIPETDTPGARAVGVHHFVDTILANWMSIREREHFLDGLNAFAERVVQDHGQSFVDLDEAEQTALLEEEQSAAGGTDDEVEQIELRTAWQDEREREIIAVPGTGEEEFLDITLRHWFRTMKELTLTGYYTSEVGASQELQYEHVPGRYDPCAELEDIGRSWA